MFYDDDGRGKILEDHRGQSNENSRPFGDSRKLEAKAFQHSKGGKNCPFCSGCFEKASLKG